MTTLYSHSPAGAPIARNRDCLLHRIRNGVIASLPVPALMIAAAALLYLRIRLYLPL